jgi:hypothetical protein
MTIRSQDAFIARAVEARWLQHQRSPITIEDRADSMTQRAIGRPPLPMCQVIVGRVRSKTVPMAEIIARPVWLVRVSRIKSALAPAFILAPPLGSFWAGVMGLFHPAGLPSRLPRNIKEVRTLTYGSASTLPQRGSKP